jgi:hypothetical protein
VSRGSGPHRAIPICALALHAFVAGGAEADPNPPSVSAGPTGVDESIAIDEPIFPGLPSGALRLWLDSRFEPDAEVGDAEVSLVEPGVKLRLRAPLGRRVGLQLTAAFRTSRYDVDDESALFEDCAGTCPAPDEFYATSLAAQTAVQLNDAGYLLWDGEHWALLVEGIGRARWESGVFEDSLTGGGGLAIGYELPRRLRVALGAHIESSLGGGGVSVSPTVALRWDVAEWARLSNRGLGLQLELRPSRHFELFVAGYRTSSRFLLDSRPGLPSEALFRDRQWLVGGGIELKPWRLLRVAVEAGAIVDRRLSLRANDEGTLDSASADPSPYVAVRLEIRP